MKWLRLIPVTPRALALVVLCSVSTLPGEERSAVSRTDEASFRIIAERNIFNANRSGRSSRGPREASRPSRVDAVALLGTMSYEKGRFAFFDGSSSEYRKALKAQGSIADFKVLDIGANSVKLDVKGQPVELRVGSQLRREDGGEWKVAAHSELPTNASGRPTEGKPPGREAGVTQGGADAGAPSSPSSSPSSSSSGGMSEALKRLIEQAKETK